MALKDGDGTANTVAAILSTCCATVEWQSRCMPIAILVQEPRSSPNGIRGCPGYQIAPDNKRFVQQWSHISYRANVGVVSRKARLPDARIASVPCPLRLQLHISRLMRRELRKDGAGRGIGAGSTALSSITTGSRTTFSLPLRSWR